MIAIKRKKVNNKQLSIRKSRHLIIDLIADSNKSGLLGGFERKASSTEVSTPAF